MVSRSGDAGTAAAQDFRNLWERLRELGAARYCEFDLSVVRGLAYYTGPVFELSARKVGLRALLGGGRYDNLTELLDGPRVSGVGFGMGDAPIMELLTELGKLPTPERSLDVFVLDVGAEYFGRALEIVGKLRAAGLACDFSYKRQAVGKQFKQAASRRARIAVVVGSELGERGEVGVKDLTSGQQRSMPIAELLSDPRRVLSAS